MTDHFHDAQPSPMGFRVRILGASRREKPKSDPNADLHRTLNNACRKWGTREIRLRYLPKPSPNRWIAEALIEHHHVIEKVRADIKAGERTLQDTDGFADQPITRGVGDTAIDAIKTIWPLQWRAPRNGLSASPLLNAVDIGGQRIDEPTQENRNRSFIGPPGRTVVGSRCPSGG